jgi:hypothetical protein
MVESKSLIKCIESLTCQVLHPPWCLSSPQSPDGPWSPHPQVRKGEAKQLFKDSWGWKGGVGGWLEESRPQQLLPLLLSTTLYQGLKEVFSSPKGAACQVNRAVYVNLYHSTLWFCPFFIHSFLLQTCVEQWVPPLCQALPWAVGTQ